MDNQGKKTNGHARGQRFSMGPTTFSPTRLHSIAGTSKQPRPLCISFRGMQNVDCRNCLKAKARSPNIGVNPIVLESGEEKFVHIVFTQEQHIYEPCSLSVFCVGLPLVYSDKACETFLKLKYPTRYNQGPASVDLVPGALSKKKSAHRLPPRRGGYGVCLKTSAIHDHTRVCCTCLAEKASGVVVVVDHTTIQHKKVGEEEQSKQSFYLRGNGIVTHPNGCTDLCTTVNEGVQSDCETSYRDEFDSSPVEDEFVSASETTTGNFQVHITGSLIMVLRVCGWSARSNIKKFAWHACKN
uniref:AlNc14C282G10121 protein n=1 Tax=Albugo laibachii Nc14 TaxID=890382 RepID=F0WUX4_9STRA|nr:AlNc14C282G10121 [Albugo laibachii Nc14]|eukprot:CCA25210.1 AlNc14C282G10121 [Albugo laibachii Nc14]